MTMLDAEGFEIPIPTREIYSSVPWRAEKLSDYYPASHLTADSFLSRWRSGRGVKFVTDLPLVPRSRITGSLPTFPLYALMARTRKKIYIFIFGRLRSCGILSGVDRELPTFRDSLSVPYPREEHSYSYWTARNYTPARPYNNSVYLVRF